MFYYNYEISEEYTYLKEEELHVLYACHWLVKNKSTIRETAANCEYSVTTLWRRIHNECRNLSPELYACVEKQLKKNHIRGMHW